jgi:hypothetical protein
MARKTSPSLRVVPLRGDRDNMAPPAHLGEDGRRLWVDLQGAYAIDDPGGLALLRVACEALDRAERCRRLIDEQGECLVIRGVPRAHPALAAERDARAAIVRAIRHLNLDLEPLRDRPGRPAGALGG